MFDWFVDGGFTGLLNGSFDGFVDGSIEGFMVSFSAGLSGASGVPQGVFVASSEANCLVTEGVPLFAKVQGKLPQGLCVDNGVHH